MLSTHSLPYACQAAEDRMEAHRRHYSMDVSPGHVGSTVRIHLAQRVVVEVWVPNSTRELTTDELQKRAFEILDYHLREAK